MQQIKAMNNYICIDIETTGLYYKKGSEIIEIAGAIVNNGVVAETYSILVRPEKDIPDNIIKLTGINKDMLIDQPSASFAINKFMNVFNLIEKPQKIIMHNSQFDYNFLKYYTHYNFQSCWEIHNIICTLELSRKLLPNESHKLEDLKKKYGIKTKSHRALNDVLCTIKVYNHLMKGGEKNARKNY